MKFDLALQIYVLCLLFTSFYLFSDIFINCLAANIFDHETTIDDETIKSSRYIYEYLRKIMCYHLVQQEPLIYVSRFRWPCTRLFADPIPKLENRNISLPAESSAIPNNKESPKASC